MKSSSRTWVGMVAASVLLVAVGCDKPKEEAPAAKGDKPAATAAAEPEMELSDDDVPVAEDFIEEATKEIDENNLNAKLDEMEKEIGTE